MKRQRSRFRSFVIDAAMRVAPGITERFLIARSRRHNERVQRNLGMHRLYDRVSTAHGSAVLAGPFKGMLYTGKAAGSLAVPKLVGSYEMELNTIIESAIGRRPSMIIDIGVAEGYYAIGFARRLAEAAVHGFDTDPVARSKCLAMARLNGVEERVRIHGSCDPASLHDLLTPGSLVICDCEGYEFELLDPSKVPALLCSDAIVEMHEHTRPGLTTAIVERFRSTHRVQLISSQSRQATDFPCLDFLKPADQARALDEMRVYPQQWAYLTAERPAPRPGQ